MIDSPPAPMPSSLLQAVNLEVHRAVAIRHQVVLRLAPADVHTIQGARKQIHRRGTKQAEMSGIERVLQSRLRALHGEIDLDLVRLAGLHCLAQIVHREEQEALGEREVFLQQSITLKATGA